MTCIDSCLILLELFVISIKRESVTKLIGQWLALIVVHQESQNCSNKTLHEPRIGEESWYLMPCNAALTPKI